VDRAAQTVPGQDLEPFEHCSVRRGRQVAESITHEALECGDAARDQRLKTIDVVFIEQTVDPEIYKGFLFRRS
jgi:hypothetical protein